MKLTNYIRDAFIETVMADTPGLDTKQLEDQAREIAIKDAVDSLPPKVAAVWKDASLRGYLQPQSVRMPDPLSNPMVPGPDQYQQRRLSPAAQSQVDGLAQQIQERHKKARDLRARLKAVVYSCSTRKALAEALPEFEKYLHEDTPKAVRNLPAVANVVADFVKAGWPKGGAKA